MINWISSLNKHNSESIFICTFASLIRIRFSSLTTTDSKMRIMENLQCILYWITLYYLSQNVTYWRYVAILCIRWHPCSKRWTKQNASTCCITCFIKERKIIISSINDIDSENSYPFMFKNNDRECDMMKKWILSRQICLTAEIKQLAQRLIIIEL